MHGMYDERIDVSKCGNGFASGVNECFACTKSTRRFGMGGLSGYASVICVRMCVDWKMLLDIRTFAYLVMLDE